MSYRERFPFCPLRFLRAGLWLGKAIAAPCPAPARHGEGPSPPAWADGPSPDPAPWPSMAPGLCRTWDFSFHALPLSPVPDDSRRRSSWFVGMWFPAHIPTSCSFVEPFLPARVRTGWAAAPAVGLWAPQADAGLATSSEPGLGCVLPGILHTRDPLLTAAMGVSAAVFSVFPCR